MLCLICFRMNLISIWAICCLGLLYRGGPVESIKENLCSTIPTGEGGHKMTPINIWLLDSFEQAIDLCCDTKCVDKCFTRVGFSNIGKDPCTPEVDVVYYNTKSYFDLTYEKLSRPPNMRIPPDDHSIGATKISDKELDINEDLARLLKEVGLYHQPHQPQEPPQIPSSFNLGRLSLSFDDAVEDLSSELKNSFLFRNITTVM